MNQMYPKRIINFISTCLLIIFLIVVVRRIQELSENFSNLTSTDITLKLLATAFLIFGLASTIAIFNKIKWGWFGVTTNLIYSLIWFFSNYQNVKPYWLIVLIVILLFAAIIIFFFTRVVRSYFEIKKLGVFLAFVIPTIVYFTLTIDPVEASQPTINSYYLEFKDGKHHLNDSIFSGDLFYNYANGQMEFCGKTEKGLAEDEWKYFDEEGNTITTSNFKNGLLHGLETTYFPWGGVSEEKKYSNGELDGNYTLWFSEDELNTRGVYNKGLKQGEWYSYDINSSIVKVDIYDTDTVVKTYYIN